VRMTNCSPHPINCARKPGAAASGPWTVAETGESSWSRCWSGENACHPLHGQRAVLDRQRHRDDLHHLGACCRLRYQAKIYQDRKRQEKVYSLRYGANRSPAGREEQLLLWWSPASARTALAADQPVRSAGLAIAMVDRTNLPDAVEN